MESLVQGSLLEGEGRGMCWGPSGAFKGTWCLTLGIGYMGAHHDSLHFIYMLCIYEIVHDTLKKNKGVSAYFPT